MDEGEPIEISDLYDEGMVDIGRLEGSGSFGELALVDGKPRFATIKCTQRTHFMTISIEDYEKAKEKIKLNERDEKVLIMKHQVPLFREGKPNGTALKKLASAFEYHNCTKDCLLIKEGEPAKYVYIVIEGDFIITKKIYSKNVQTEDVNKIKEDPIKAHQRQSKFNRKNNQRKVDIHVLGYVTPGYLIGEDDVRLGYETYSTTVKCIKQTARLLQITRDDFVRLLQNQTAVWNLLSNMV